MFFHLIGLHKRGAIVLRQKMSRSQRGEWGQAHGMREVLDRLHPGLATAAAGITDTVRVLGAG
jgi:hypothetical protein